MKRHETDTERVHAADQIAVGLAARCLTSEQGEQLYVLVGCSKDGGFLCSADQPSS